MAKVGWPILGTPMRMYSLLPLIAWAAATLFFGMILRMFLTSILEGWGV